MTACTTGEAEVPSTHVLTLLEQENGRVLVRIEPLPPGCVAFHDHYNVVPCRDGKRRSTLDILMWEESFRTRATLPLLTNTDDAEVYSDRTDQPVLYAGEHLVLHKVEVTDESTLVEFKHPDTIYATTDFFDNKFTKHLLALVNASVQMNEPATMVFGIPDESCRLVGFLYNPGLESTLNQSLRDWAKKLVGGSQLMFSWKVFELAVDFSPHEKLSEIQVGFFHLYFFTSSKLFYFLEQVRISYTCLKSVAFTRSKRIDCCV